MSTIKATVKSETPIGAALADRISTARDNDTHIDLSDTLYRDAWMHRLLIVSVNRKVQP